MPGQEPSFSCVLAYAPPMTEIGATTDPKTARQPGQRPRAPRARLPERLGREVAETLRLAVPLALAQLGQIGMLTTDLMLLGRLGDSVVAAAALAHTVLFAAFAVGMGLVSAVAPLAAQALGARDPRGVRRAVRTGMIAACLSGIPVLPLLVWGVDILTALGQPEPVAQLAGRYLAGLGWSLVPAWVFIALRGFMSALNRPQPALWITICAVPVNAILAYALIYGALGLPRLDLLGAGLATTVVNAAMCVAAVAVAYTCRPFRKYHILGRIWRVDWVLLVRLLAIGAPVSVAFLLEFGVFAAAALTMGAIGTSALAAHQIALQVASILFMVPFGISMAATVRVGHAFGRNDPPAIRRAGFAAIELAAVFMTAMTFVVVLARHVIPGIFLGATTPAVAEAASVAATLLLVGSTFFIADGIQTVAAGALRGFNDTRIPLILAGFSFWVVGFTSCWALATPLGLGAPGVWIGLSLGLVTNAVLLAWRFERLTRSPRG